MSIFKNLLIPEIDNNKIGIVGLTKELNALYISNIESKNILVVCSSLFEASNLYQSLSSYNNEDEIFLFPMDEFLSSQAIELNPEFKTTRINVLNKICESNKNKIVITNLTGYLRFLPSVNEWKEKIITLKVNQKISYKNLIEKLINLGYERNTLVTSTGEIGIRGFVIDIFPIGYENPIRIEFFDNEIESIRYFDINTQKSISEINEINIYPYSEKNLSEENYNSENKPNTIKNYLDNPLVVYNDYDLLKISENKIKIDIKKFSKESNQDNIKFMYELDEIINQKEIYIMNNNLLANLNLDKVQEYKSSEVSKYNGNILKLKEDLEKYINIYKIILCMKNQKEAKNILDFFKDDAILTTENKIFENRINIIVKDITTGYFFNKHVFISSNDIFNIKDQKIKFRNNYHSGSKLKNLDKLNIGDYVVHSIYGVGIYNGIKVLTKLNIKKDYIEVLYRGNDKLYIPVEKMNLLSKYSGKEGIVPKINKLGSTEWIKTKLSVRKRIENIALKLLNLYAQREADKGFAFGPDTEEQKSFDSEFVYELTQDQEIAIYQIKQDMELEKPMDRLLCGDVGFGKTEVAFRAMFKAVSYSKQVMYLCPTTILSKQQYDSAKERFKNYPINIALLNRFVKLSVAKKVVEDFNNGKIDILFGTHRILSKDIIPKDLGLLVIDEEQRFGVTHKERIKEYKNNVDVLTLSATPIPRTLQMSLVGIRNLSLIETPPVNRYPISTYVTPYNKNVIKEAIYSELSRNGQIFILYNKISDIEKKVNEIKELVPEASITYAHGAMSKNELENRMIDFVEHRYDILLCTTIIETGIDIPNVNTLIIIDANNFGLSQLYQIRGRVGRTNKIAFAYLMYDQNKILTETAIKRLQTIKDFTYLGNGFKIASRDLAIRGAGDILGSEQAGFIDTIGIELYIKMLNEEVNKIKGLNFEEEEIDETKQLVNVETHISSDYVEDSDLKIEIHKIINEISSYKTLLEKKELLEDRFGKITKEIDIYMHECWFEKIAKSLNITEISQTKNYIQFSLPKEITKEINAQELFFSFSDITNSFRFSYKHEKIIITLEIKELKNHFIYYLITGLGIIKKMIK